MARYVRWNPTAGRYSEVEGLPDPDPLNDQRLLRYDDATQFWVAGQKIVVSSIEPSDLEDGDIWIDLDSAGGGTQVVDIFTASGTWTKPEGATTVKVIACGGGGGGGSGARGASGTYRPGGGGGGAGGTFIQTFGADFFDDTESVVVGAGGTGGASITTDSTSGQDGTDGGSTYVDNLFVALGGLKGAAGTLGSPSVFGGQTKPGWIENSTWGSSVLVEPLPGSGGAGYGADPGSDPILLRMALSASRCVYGPSGGGGGSGVSDGNVAIASAGSAGRFGGDTGTGSPINGLFPTQLVLVPGPLTAAATDGVDAPTPTVGWLMSGLGGSGGSGGTGGLSAAAGRGGHGKYGGGGGGGGGAANGNNSGAGGNGGDGFMIFITTLA